MLQKKVNEKRTGLIEFYIKETQQMSSFIDNNNLKSRELNQKDLIRFEKRIKILKSIRKIIISS